MDNVRVLLADRSRMFREGLSRILSGHSAITVTHQAGSMAEATEYLNSDDGKIDVLLCDPHGDRAELAALAKVADTFPTIKIMLLTDDVDASLVDSAIAMGARAVLSKETDPEAVPLSVQLVQLGEQIYPSLHAPRKRGHQPTAPTAPEPPGGQPIGPKLTPREQQILEAIQLGKGNKEIAEDLGVSPATIKSLLTKLFPKIGVTNRTQAAAWGTARA